jgi:poly-beta-1,6-N-acetyl-D-glucosamine synthase
MLLLFLALVWAGVTVLQILIWIFFPGRWAWQYRSVTPPVPAVSFPVSIVICARNEAPRLRQNLPLVLQQQWPAPFEVVVVDDDSTDDTPAVLAALGEQFPHLRPLRLHPKSHPGKKIALSRGIAFARHSWLLFTDADCQPASSEWLSQMMRRTTTPGFVLGYAPLHPQQHWLNGWARFETVYTAMQYFSTAFAGWPFMGVGRNMAVHRRLFDAAGGFSRHLHLTGGDDDLLVNSVATGNNTALCLDPAAFVYSPAKDTLNGWLRQKRRHVTAGTGYKTWHNLVLGGVAFTHAVHYGLSAILWVAQPQWAPWIIGGYLLRLAVVWPVYARACAHLHARDLIPLVPLYDGILAVWHGAVAPLFLLFPPKKNW